MTKGDEASLDVLMARLADGDRSAFEPLFREFHPRALRLARVKLAGADAEDAAQSALEKVFARAGEFTAGRAALPWFYAVVANEVRGLQRKAHANAGRDGGEDAMAREAAADDTERALLDAELEAALRDAIQRLDAPSREAIARLLGEAESGEAAGARGVAERKRVSRAYARLRAMLERFHG